ncbi:MAG: hypothetical protein P4L75_03035 [Clostridia bacterium]|nr:hypothetical protein [Clostridia bacterium]MDR3643762.1 hypothetical protein [Clostridia bacterium]
MKKAALFMVFLLAAALALTVFASADMGPKPSLEIVLQNAPDDACYADLLVDYTDAKLYSNLSSDDFSGLDEARIQKLAAYRDGEWRPALLTGTYAPLYGKLTGEKSGKNYVYQYSYMGVPDYFRVIILTKDGRFIVSQPVRNTAFNGRVYFNAKTAKASQLPAVLSYLLEFLATCGATLLIEGAVLLLFRFSLRLNWKPFLLINVFTQILLTAVVWWMMYRSGPLDAVLAYLPFEIVIFILEAILFARFLRQHSKLRRVLFALAANTASFAVGLAVLHFRLIH